MAVISPVVLPLDAARTVSDAALDAIRETGIPGCVTVVDGGGHVVNVVRMDGAVLASIESSLAKARTAVYFGGSTADLARAVAPGGQLSSIEAAFSVPLAFVAGGMPLLDSAGIVVGGIGVGGGSPAADDRAAEAGAAALGARS